MRIQHNIAALNSFRNYNSNTNSISGSLEKLSSGYRINRAGDDAAGLAISEKMRAQITGLQRAQTNANDGISLIQTAEGALTEVHSMLNRIYDLAEQSANGVYDDDVDRLNLQKEVRALTDEIDRIAQSTNFNGRYLLNGETDGKIRETVAELDSTTAMSLRLQIGDSGDPFNKLSVKVSCMGSKALGISTIKAKVGSKVESNGKGYGQGVIFVGDQDAAMKALSSIKNAINIVSSTRGDLGALQNRLDHTIKNLSVAEENITNAESRIRDVDMAKEMTAYTKNNILIQASQAMLAQANTLPQGVLQLLQ